jgi:PAS domain S-box-containing protein
MSRSSRNASSLATSAVSAPHHRKDRWSQRQGRYRLFEAEKQRSLALAQANRDLAEREAKIRRLVDANIIGIFISSLKGRVLEANDAFLHLVGHDRNALVSGCIRWTDLTPPEWRERDKRALAELSSNTIAQPYEKEFFRKDGSRVPVLIGSALFEEGGHEGVAFVLDLTERRRAEEALREEQERLRQLESEFAHMNRLSVMGELAASLAHEITQPIASARNNARAALNFLDHQPPNLGEVREALDSVVGDADRAGAIIDRIRDQMKKAPPQKRRFDLNEAINEVIVLARGEITKNGVSVDTHLTERALSVEGDRVQLQQVVLNLIMNAVEAMGSVQEGPRELSISTEQTQANGVLVAVRDTGPGIDGKHLERVFQPFYTTKSSGVGMGLSICRSIIDAHGGRLWTDANEPRGAVFQFTLPDMESESHNSAIR